LALGVVLGVRVVEFCIFPTRTDSNGGDAAGGGVNMSLMSRLLKVRIDIHGAAVLYGIWLVATGLSHDDMILVVVFN